MNSFPTKTNVITSKYIDFSSQITLYTHDHSALYTTMLTFFHLRHGERKEHTCIINCHGYEKLKQMVQEINFCGMLHITINTVF